MRKRVDADPEYGARLSALTPGSTAQVTGIDQAAAPAVVRRLRELGFRKGTVVRCLRRAPLGSPTVYQVGESDICLRPAEAQAVAVDTPT